MHKHKDKTMSDETEIMRCKFCGKVLRGRGVERGYCHTCHMYGNDIMHQETGRTNGWDRKKKKSKPVVHDEMRGNHMLGGYSLRNRIQY